MTFWRKRTINVKVSSSSNVLENFSKTLLNNAMSPKRTAKNENIFEKLFFDFTMSQLQIGLQSCTMNGRTENRTLWNLTTQQTHHNNPLVDILLEANSRILWCLLQALLEIICSIDVLQLKSTNATNIVEETSPIVVAGHFRKLNLCNKLGGRHKILQLQVSAQQTDNQSCLQFILTTKSGKSQLTVQNSKPIKLVMSLKVRIYGGRVPVLPVRSEINDK